MGQSREKLRIFENVMARVGLSGDFLGEYFKALSSLNGLQTYNELNPPTLSPNSVGGNSADNMLQTPPVQANTPLGDPNALNVPQNTSNGMV
jgi:hypothetical protein